MRVCYPDLSIDFELIENQVNVLQVENVDAFSKMVNSLWEQSEGRQGTFVLSDDFGEKHIDKELECIINPFSIEYSDKKILNALYKEIKEIANEKLQQDYLTLNGAIVSLLDKTIQDLPYSIDFELAPDINGLFKMYDLKIVSDSESLIERLIEYLRLKNQLCGISIFVLVSLKQYFSKEAIKELYKFAFLQKISLILIEPSDGEVILEEKKIIIDKDLCLITVG